MKFLRYFILILLTVFLNPVFADQSASDLAKILSTVTSMQASFTQTIFNNHGKAIQRSFGRMAMQRPGKFRWEVQKPIPQLIIANDTKLWVYDPDLEQVTIRSLKKAAGETPALLLSHEGTSIEEDFNVKQMPQKKPGWQWFTLTPKKAGNMFANVQLGFLNNQIHEMRLQDNLGHTTTINFNNIKTNLRLASSSFIFKPKAKVDVIDETRR